MKAADNTTQWVKFGTVRHLSFIGKDVLFYGTGCHLRFIHMVTGEEHTFSTNVHSVNGEGVRCISGHKIQPFFAYAECSPYPNVFIMQYPSFEKVCVLPEGPFEGYCNISFSEISLMVTLGEIPHFMITVWNWKTGEKLASKMSNICYSPQILRSSPGKPLCVIQMAVNTHYLNIWDIHLCCKNCIITQHALKLPKIKPPPFVAAAWGYDKNIFVADAEGGIYMVDQEHQLDKIIDLSVPASTKLSLDSYKNGIIISSFTEVRMYQKKQHEWTNIWSFTPKEPLVKILNNRSDFVVGLQESQELVVYNYSEDGSLESKLLTSDESNINDFCLVNPAGIYIVTLRHNTILTAIDLETGNSLDKMVLKHRAIKLRGNSNYPFFAVGYEHGLIELISTYTITNMHTITSLQLSRNPITQILFYERGRMLVVTCRDSGEIFILKGTPGSQIRAVASVTVKQPFIDCTLIGSKNCYRLFVLLLTSNEFQGGNRIIRYCIIDKNTINVKEYEMENSLVHYYKIYPTFHENRDRILYALPYNSKMIHILETRRGSSTVKIMGKIPSGHQLRKMEMRVTQYLAITWGPDGFVFVRNNTFDKPVALALAHHRLQGGVKKAIVNALVKFIITYGRDELLVCTKNNHFVPNQERQERIDGIMASSKLELMFSTPTLGFASHGKFAGKTWIEIEEMLRVERERVASHKERAAILSEFQLVKKLHNDLLTENLNGPDNEKLDMQEFILNQQNFKARKIQNEQICQENDKYLRALIECHKKVYDWIKTNCWDGMDVTARDLWCFFGQLTVSKYTLLPVDQALYDRRTFIEEVRSIEIKINEGDSFRPWIPRSSDNYKLMLQHPTIHEKEYKLLFDLKNDDLDTQVSLIGSVAPLFNEISKGHMKQRQLATFYNDRFAQTICEIEVIRLKQKFNKEFDLMMLQKERDMANIKERNERMKYILSEINYYSKVKYQLNVADPQWHLGEYPEQVLVIRDEDIPVVPYISPSRQLILDAQAAEEERIRLLLLADDFRERTLMKMMNGVLEVRWEDELKNDVPPPKCMHEKDPMDFNEEDLKAVKEYEEKVTMLTSERNRYRKMLMVEYGKITTFVRETVKKFDKKVQDLLDFKASLDSANNHENLITNRRLYQQNRRLAMNREEEDIMVVIHENEDLVDSLQKLINSLTENMKECKSALETYQSREKQLEKGFRKDFAEYSSVILELALKYYKKRPKASLRSVSVTGLYELAKCVVSGKKPRILYQEHANYLSALDTLDMYVGIPPVIEEPTYALIRKHRRLKIEYEIKVKAMIAEITEGENTVAAFQKRLEQKKQKNLKLLNDLDDLRVRRLAFLHNKQIQFVFKCGSVEIPLHGGFSDFNDAVLIKRSEVEEVNRLINIAGNGKLNAMKENNALHRKIVQMEWEHKKLRMHINDFIYQLKEVTDVYVTQDMANYLKMRKRGIVCKDADYELQIEIIRSNYENLIREKKEHHSRAKRQVKVIKESNKELDLQIRDMNVDVASYELEYDNLFCEIEKELMESRLKLFMKRTNLAQAIQKNHTEVMALQTQLELLRLKTFPTFKYQVL